VIDRRNVLIGCAALTASASANANQNELSLIIGSGIGGSLDTSTRLLASHFSKVDINAVSTNRPAGNGVEAAIHVANQPANSNVILSNGISAILISPARERLPYDKDSFSPICMFSTAAFVLVVKSTSRFFTIGDLISAGKSGSISIANGGFAEQYTVAKIAEVTGINIVNAVYRSGGAAAQDLMSGAVDAAYISLASIAGIVASGDVRMLAHTSTDGSQIPSYSNVPHIFSIGSRDPGMLSYNYHALYASKNMPISRVRDIADKVQQVCRDSKFIDEHLARGMQPKFMGPNELRAHHDIVQRDMIVPYIEWLRINGK
jgi:tripartite-type tricarboxylate transporter receptor subunit TctC